MSDDQKNFPSKLGFTLIEVLITVLIFSVVCVVTVTLYLSQKRLTESQFRLTDTQVRMSASLNTVLPLIFDGREILTSAVIGGQTYTTDNDTVVLRVPSIDDDNFTISGLFDTVALTLSANNNLDLAVEAMPGSSRVSNTRTVLNDIDDFEIVYENDIQPSESKWFEFTVSKNVQSASGSIPISLTHRGTLRNK